MKTLCRGYSGSCGSLFGLPLLFLNVIDESPPMICGEEAADVLRSYTSDALRIFLIYRW